MHLCLRRLLQVLFLLLTAATAKAAWWNDTLPGSRTVLLISIDGFRFDYFDSIPTPQLHRLAAAGTRAQWMIPSFPTKTFPNHYTLVTGLRPGLHGIVGNRFYDTTFHALFQLRDRETITQSRWWGGEPIWVTAERQGVKAATMFWPGSESELHGKRPTYWCKYDQSTPYDKRVSQVLAWFDLPPTQRPQLVTVYFEGVDDAGHRFGPFTPQLRAAVMHVDSAIGELISGLELRRLSSTTDVIVVSDHGMTAVSRDRVIYLDDYIRVQDVLIHDWSPVTSFWPKPGVAADSLFVRLQGAHPHLRVYRKSELPERYGFTHPSRVGPIVLVADGGWEITTHTIATEKGYETGGDHGFDNNLPDMRAFFAGRGPSLHAGRVVPPFSNTDIYGLMCRLLNLQPAPNEGDTTIIRTIIR